MNYLSLQRSAPNKIDSIPLDGWTVVEAPEMQFGYRGAAAVSPYAIPNEIHALGGVYIASFNSRPLPHVIERVDISWLTELYSSAENINITSSQLQKVITNVTSLLSRKKYDDLAFIMASLKFDRVAPEVLIALARLTAQMRTKIGHWTTFVTKAEQSLNARNLNGRKLLRGLIKPVHA